MSEIIPDENNSIDFTIPNEVMENDLNLEHNKNWTNRNKLGKAVSSAIIWTELMPSNEGIRIAATTLAHFAFHGDPTATAAVLGLTTFGVEAGGGLVTADFIDGGGGEKWMGIVKDRVEQTTGQNIHTNLATETLLASVLGVPAAQFTRQIQNQELTRKENRRYGTLMAIGTTAISTAYLYGNNELINKVPVPEKIGIGLVAVGVVVGAFKTAKTIIRRRSNIEDNPVNELSEE
jgi:hypothetical protein